MHYKNEINNLIDGFFEALTIYAHPDVKKIRLGNNSDGGYVVSEKHIANTSILLSYGIGDDVGFEKDFSDCYPDAIISMNDPSITGLPEDIRNAVFNADAFSQLTLIDKITEGCTLKIDIEGNEWDAFNIPPNNFKTMMALHKIDQLLIEFHFIHASVPSGLSPYFTELYQQEIDKINIKLLRKYLRVLKVLNEVFTVFHIHINNTLQPQLIGDRWLPPLIEVSYVRKKLVPNMVPIKANLPIDKIDFPNKPNKPDISIVWPPNHGGSNE